MKRSIAALSLILLVAACTEPKMKLRAAEPNELEKKEVALKKTDSLAADTVH